MGKMSNLSAMRAFEDQVMQLTRTKLAQLFDSTLLVSYATETEIIKLCRDALRQGFHSVCVNPFWVHLSSSIVLEKLSVCSVVGFPLGANKLETKLKETELAIDDGANEIDFVLNICALKESKFDVIQKEVAQFVETSKHGGNERGIEVTTKLILETYLFLHVDREDRLAINKDILRRACYLAAEAKIDFVKTCTGFDTGAGKSFVTPDDVAFLKSVVGQTTMVKASGGIRTLSQVIELVRSGASRIGTSSAASIMEEFDSKQVPSIPISVQS